MAYKPKYVQTRSAPEKTVIQRQMQQMQGLEKQQMSQLQTPERQKKQQVPSPEKQQKKSDRGKLICFIVLGVVLIPLSSFLTVLLMGNVFENVGRPRQLSYARVSDMQIQGNLENLVLERIDAIRNSMVPADRPDIPEAAEPTEETIPPVRKQYWIEEGTQVAPEPNQALFGETGDPTSLEPVLKKAKWILEGQELFFSTDVEIFEGSKVRYYLDDSIFAITWKEPRDGSVYTFSEVKVSHPSQFRRHLSDGAYGSGKLYLPTEMAATVNAVVATSGDFYANRPIFGVVAYEGQVRRDVDDGYAETCYIDKNGDLIFSYMGQLKNSQNAQAFLEEHEINFSLAFGPILVDNYEVKELGPVYGVGEIREEYARSALCQMDKLHYLIAVANWEGNQPDDPTVAQFQKVIATTGCKMAYCLDGGQTAAVVMNDQLINRPAKGEQRRISDIIYFATAVPDGGGDNG